MPKMLWLHWITWEQFDTSNYLIDWFDLSHFVLFFSSALLNCTKKLQDIKLQQKSFALPIKSLTHFSPGVASALGPQRRWELLPLQDTGKKAPNGGCWLIWRLKCVSVCFLNHFVSQGDKDLRQTDSPLCWRTSCVWEDATIWDK